MLVPALAQDAALLKATADLGAVFAVLLRQPVAQRPVAEAQPETLDYFAGAQPTLLQVLLCLNALLQCVVVVVDGFAQRALRLDTTLNR